MRVDEKVALAGYFEDRRFESRIPRPSPAAAVYRCGDNIYRPLVPNARDVSEFEQVPNKHHGPEEKDHDLNGRNALIARRFAYFGVEALRVPREVRPNVPTGQSGHGTETRDRTRVQGFIDYVFGTAHAPVIARPHQWPPGDASWKGLDAAALEHERPAPAQATGESQRHALTRARRPRPCSSR